MRRQALALAVLVQLAAPAAAGEPDDAVARGEAILAANCARCHAIGPEGDSPLTLAPRFRDLHTRYPIEGLAEALAEGIVTGHDAMPQLAFEPDEISAILAYLETLRPKP